MPHIFDRPLIAALTSPPCPISHLIRHTMPRPARATAGGVVDNTRVTALKSLALAPRLGPAFERTPKLVAIPRPSTDVHLISARPCSASADVRPARPDRSERLNFSLKAS